MKRINEIVPALREKEIHETGLAKLSSELAIEEKNNAEFLERWEKLNEGDKLAVIKTQVKECEKTADTVYLPGRININQEQELLFVMMTDVFAFYGITDRNIIRSVTEVICDEYGYLSIQDCWLFFTKIKKGLYGDVYGKLNGGWITSKLANFFKSVNYNMTVKNDRRHYEIKRMQGSRDLEGYYDDVKPEILE